MVMYTIPLDHCSIWAPHWIPGERVIEVDHASHGAIWSGEIMNLLETTMRDVCLEIVDCREEWKQ